MESGIELVLKITVTVIIEVKFWFSYISFLLFWAAEGLLLRERWGLFFLFPLSTGGLAVDKKRERRISVAGEHVVSWGSFS